MNLFDLFKKKERCADCFCAIQGESMVLEGARYCKDCFQKRRAVLLKVAAEKEKTEQAATKEWVEQTKKSKEVADQGKIVAARPDNALAQSQAAAQKSAQVPGTKHENRAKLIHLGSFSFTEEECEKVKSAAVRYLPKNWQTVKAQEMLVNNLGAVLPRKAVSVLQPAWFYVEDALDETVKTMRFRSALAETAVLFNSVLGDQEPENLKHLARGATMEDLLKVWMTADLYGHLIKAEAIPNVLHYRDCIQSLILEADDEKNRPQPLSFDGTAIHFDSKILEEWKKKPPLNGLSAYLTVIPLKEKEPVVTLYEDGVKTKEYVLQTEENEDFTGKYLHFSVRFSLHGNPTIPIIQMDGFVNDVAEDTGLVMGQDDVCYRLEACFLACGGEDTKRREEMNRGQDLEMKALKYHGLLTPSNVRLIGICPDCGKSFAFHGYAFYMGQEDVAYSDDGLDCCTFYAGLPDKETRVIEVEGKTFRYYNSFCCPHCGTPYIDYKKHPEMKRFGVSGCVLLGRKHFDGNP